MQKRNNERKLPKKVKSVSLFMRSKIFKLLFHFVPLNTCRSYDTRQLLVKAKTKTMGVTATRISFITKVFTTGRFYQLIRNKRCDISTIQ